MIAVILAFAAAGSGPFQTAPAFSPPSSQPSPPPHPPSNGGGERWGLVGEPLPEVNLAYEREAKALRAEMHALQEVQEFMMCLYPKGPTWFTPLMVLMLVIFVLYLMML